MCYNALATRVADPAGASNTDEALTRNMGITMLKADQAHSTIASGLNRRGID